MGGEVKHIVMGRINGVHGVRGWLKVFSYSRPKENIFSYHPLYIEHHGGDWKPRRVIDWTNQGKGLLALFDGITDRTQAQALVGLNIGVARENLPVLADNEYYWCDLLGLDVFDQDEKGLGRIVEVRETGANDVLVVEGPEKHLIPFLKGDVVKDVDLVKGRVLVDWTGDFI